MTGTDLDTLPHLPSLPDEQLLALIEAACNEAERRSLRWLVAVETAQTKIAMEREQLRLVREQAQAAAQEEAERQRRADAAAKQAEAERQQAEKTAAQWDWKEDMGRRISDVLRPKNAQTLKVWNRGDKRIYLGGGYNDNMVVYHHTGNHRAKPRALDIVKRPGNFTPDEWTAEKQTEVKAALLPLFAETCQKWNTVEFEIPAWQAPEPEGENS